MKIKGSNNLIDGILRKYIFQGGNRILSKKDLVEVEKMNPKSYQLEVAINKYMMNEGKTSKWIKFSALNPHKIKKLPFWEGLIKDLKMDMEIISFLGIRDYMRQMVFSAKEELK